MDLTTSMILSDHDLFDGQTSVTVEIFDPTTETYGPSSAPFNALRRAATSNYESGGLGVQAPGDIAPFSVSKANWPGSRPPAENDRITDSNGDVWRVMDGSPDEMSLRSRWVIKVTRAN